MSDKAELRRFMRRLRDSLNEDLRREWSGRICRFAEGLVKRGDTVFVYAAVGSEVETDGLIRALWAKGCRVCLPVIRGKGIMDAVLYAAGDELRDDRYGIPAPCGGEIVLPEEIDFIFLPGLAFDLQGGRLGYGGGYYDRFCARSSAARIALAYDVQIIGALPMEAWDVIMDGVVSETEIRWLR